MIELHVLGTVELAQSGEADPHPLQSHSKCMGLLAYLAAARPNGCHRRDKLAALFWPDSDQKHARAALRKSLFLLRRSLGSKALWACGDGDLSLDFHRFHCDVVAFREALNRGEPRAALREYGGDLMDGFHLGDLWEFESWLEEERKRLREQAAGAAWVLASREEERGNGVEAAHWARRAAAFSIYSEVSHRRLLRLLDRLGDRSGAIREHEDFARRLCDDLDVSPSPETEELVRNLRARRELRESGAGSGWGARPGDSGSGPSHPDEERGSEGGVLAVLPFATLTRDEESEAFADGLHQEVITQLLSLRRVKTRSRTSVMAYRACPGKVGTIAEELEASWLLEGSVRIVDDRVRVAVELVDGGRDHPVWSESLEGVLEDPLRLQIDMALQVARALAERLGAGGADPPLPGGSPPAV